MKTRFSTLDIIAILPELKAKICTGWRVNQIYDCDSKTFLFKLNKSIVKMKKDDDPVSVNEETANKMTLIIESGLRMHTTDFDWPKSHAPSHFATKLRKHIRNKRIEDIKQVGVDRLIDMQFGTGVAANHLLIELYDKGNLILTDSNYTIINIMRWRKPTFAGEKQQSSSNADQKDSENFKIGDIYPLHLSRKQEDVEAMTVEKITQLLSDAQNLLSRNQNYKKRNRVKQDKDEGLVEVNLKDLLNPYVIYGGSLLEDRLLTHVFKDDPNVKKCVVRIPVDSLGRLDKECVSRHALAIKAALDEADTILSQVKEREKSPGYLVQKKQAAPDIAKVSDKKKQSKKDDGNEEPKITTTNIDFFPILSCTKRKIAQEANEELVYEEFESFDKAVDVYYCNLESQKLDSKALVAEKEAMKKLDNLKLAQEKRLDELARAQKDDEEKARLIELNCDKVEDALLIIRSMLANQMSWADISMTIKEAQAMKDPIASLITRVNFERNEFTIKLSDPYDDESDDLNENDKAHNNMKRGDKKEKGNKRPKYREINIDISLSAYANARRFFVKRRTAVIKEKKTIEVSKKAFKNVERQTKEKLKDVVVKANITKARKRYWFENFFWFISSDGYLVVAGRDAEQNEMLVKRYMKSNDIYVHADLHGASSVIIKNETSDPVPPKTLVEAGSMAVCYSSAWDSKIATSSWWVYPKQVSKTAPAGEYLTVGAFIIRGKKNFLPLSNLVLGFGFLFRLEEDSIERRKKDRLARELGSKNQKNETAIDTTGVDHADEGDQSEDESISGQESSDEVDKKHPDADDLNSRPAHQSAEDEPSVSESPVIDVDEDVDLEDEIEEDGKVVEHRLIDTITESPLPDDVLLYAIPMCGPYSAFQNFKYKVKVIPGANKRGKAAKACHNMFLFDKRATPREKDLLRALKDQDYARNIPNKVKISSANMKSITKKRPKKSEVRLPLQ